MQARCLTRRNRPSRRIWLWLHTWAMSGLLVLAWTGSVAAAEQQITPRAIAHPSVDTEFINRKTLRSVFTLRVRTWPDGTPVHVFVLEDGDKRHAAFCSDVLGTFPYILRRAWDRNLFSGTGLVPVTVRNESEMLQRVADTPGAVGYLTQAEDPAFLKENAGVVIESAPRRTP